MRWSSASYFFCFSFFVTSTLALPVDPVSERVLRAFKDSLENLEAFREDNNLVGWDDGVPVCNWTFVTCNDAGQVLTLEIVSSAIATDKNIDTLLRTQARGKLPVDIVDLPALVKLDLSWNYLPGELPAAWGSDGVFSNLTFLALDGTNLTGVLPESWGLRGAFPSLGYLSMHNNSLTGPLPDTWASQDSLSNLQVLALHYNKLHGYVPNGMAALGKYTTYLWLKPGNDDMCGPCPLTRMLVVCEQKHVMDGSLKLSLTDASTCKPLYTLGPQCPSDGVGNPVQVPVNDTVLPVFLEMLYDEEPTFSFDEQHHDSLVAALAAVCPSAVPDRIRILSPTSDGSWGEDAVSKSNSTIGGRRRLLAAGDGASGGGNAPRAAQLRGRHLEDLDDPSHGKGVERVNLVAATIRANNNSKSSDLERELGQGIDNGELLRLLQEGGWDGLSAVNQVTHQVGAAAAGTASEKASARQAADGTAEPAGEDADGNSVLLAVSIAVPIATVLVLGAVIAAFALWWRRRARAATAPPSNSGSLHTVKKSGDSELQPSGGGSGDSASRGLRKLPSQMSRRMSMVVVDATFLSDCVSNATLSDWEINPEHLQLCERPDGQIWELGRGSFSRVYKALYDGVHQVAVKVLLPDAGSDSLGAAEFQKEVAILRRCHNRNLVQFLGACVADQQLLLAFEYMEGGDLFKWLSSDSKGMFTFQGDEGKQGLAYRVAVDVARGLHFLHSQRIVHNDLKSANILLARDGTAKIGDVGLARVLRKDYVSTTSGVVGTFAWAAPEVLLGRPFGERADIYSYGVVLWELATKEKPERGMLRRPRVPEECPEGIAELIFECLDENPRRRPSAKEIVERLQAMQSPVPGECSGSATSSSGGDRHPAVYEEEEERSSTGCTSEEQREGTEEPPELPSRGASGEPELPSGRPSGEQRQQQLEPSAQQPQQQPEPSAQQPQQQPEPSVQQPQQLEPSAQQPQQLTGPSVQQLGPA